MIYKLRDAMRRKAEYEGARFDSFEVHVRARTMRLIANRLGLDPVPLMKAIAIYDDAQILAQYPGANAFYAECNAEARRQLTAERDDPGPHRLA